MVMVVVFVCIHCAVCASQRERARALAPEREGEQARLRARKERERRTLTKSFMLKRSVSPFLAATAAMPSALPPASASSPCAQEACVGRRQVCLGLGPSACPSMCACAPCIRVCVHVHEWEQEARVPRGGAHARGGGGSTRAARSWRFLAALAASRSLGSVMASVTSSYSVPNDDTSVCPRSITP